MRWIALVFTFGLGCGGNSPSQLDAAMDDPDAGSDAGADAPPDGGLASPGTSSGTLEVAVDIVCRVTARSGGESTCAIGYDVSVEQESDGTDVDDAVVEIGPVGAMMTLASDGNGDYVGTSTGWADHFALSVTRGSDFLTGAVIEAPRPYTLTLAPDPAQPNQANTLAWTPPHPGSYSLVAVTRVTAPAAVTYTGAIEPDQGTELLPASTFPSSGNYIVEVGRATRTTLAGPRSLAVIVFVRRPLETVP